MRVSIRRDDPGYTGDRRWLVTLDGVEVKYCVTADDVEGFVLVHERGLLRWELSLVRKEGRVKIRPVPES